MRCSTVRSDPCADQCYEVKDPDMLRMQKQNEALKEALNEANQSVQHITNIFATQTVSTFAVLLFSYWGGQKIVT